MADGFFKVKSLNTENMIFYMLEHCVSMCFCSFKVLFCIFLHILLHKCYIDCFKENNIKYDLADFQILRRKFGNRKLPLTHLNTSGEKADLETQFTSFGKKFHMILSEDKQFQDIRVRSYTSDKFSKQFKSQAKFYDGHLKDSTLNSNIVGFLRDGLFTGKITDENQTYFIEPANTFFDNMQSSSKIVVYKDSDIWPLEGHFFPSKPENIPEWKVLYRLPNVSMNVTVENTGLDISNQTQDLFCEIEIVADHTLYNFFNNDTDRLSAFLYLHSKFADFVFRRADFNMDGDPDGIRIVVGKISIYTSDKNKNYPMLYASSLTDYLTLFASRIQDSRFCLSIAMFFRKYDGMAVGEAFKAHVRYSDAIGGICDQPVKDYDGYETLSLNTGAINMQFQNGNPLPLGVSMLAFTHEIGHGFGSAHDPLNDRVCSPEKSGYYLMYPVVSANSSKNALKFSRCSLQEIKKVLTVKGSCLKYRNYTCGNSIREEGEECDCGVEKSCDLIDPCCTPSDAKPPEKGCTIRSKKGYQCSPKESVCCNKSCLVERNKEILCYNDDIQCLYSFCDGKTEICPNPKKVSELCVPKFTCNNKTCSNTTICANIGLKDCLCDAYLSIQCLQCCKNNNSCVPASEFGLLSSDGRPYILKSGASCNNGNYECDSAGNCVSNIYRSNTSPELYIGLTVIPLLVMLLIISAICFSPKREDDLIPITDSI